MRKYKQGAKEQYERSSARVMEGYKSLLLLADSLFNKGKNFEQINPPSFDDMLRSREQAEERTSKFVGGQWWIK